VDDVGDFSGAEEADVVLDYKGKLVEDGLELRKRTRRNKKEERN